MPEHADALITHAYLFTMQGDGVGYIADGAVAVQYVGHACRVTFFHKVRLSRCKRDLQDYKT